MKCEEAAEFVSVLFDGERIPTEAAEHISACETCRMRLQDYTVAAVELRRAASLNWPADLRTVDWGKQRRNPIGWWQKGAEAMRIPRFAFALMLMVILGLGSSLAIVKARANTSGPVVLVTMRLPGVKGPFRCALFTNGNPRGQECAWLAMANGGSVGATIRFIQKDTERIRLGIRGHFSLSPIESSEDLKAFPEKEYEFEPGEKLKVEITGLEEAELTGEVLDHMPALPWGNEALDPAENELRVVSPILLEDQKVILDMEGGSTSAEPSSAVVIYFPRIGRCIFALQPLEDGVQGEVNLNRIHFEVNGQHYHLIAGVPITRAEKVWVRLDREYRPDKDIGPGIGSERLADLRGKR